MITVDDERTEALHLSVSFEPESYFRIVDSKRRARNTPGVQEKGKQTLHANRQKVGKESEFTLAPRKREEFYLLS